MNSHRHDYSRAQSFLFIVRVYMGRRKLSFVTGFRWDFGRPRCCHSASPGGLGQGIRRRREGSLRRQRMAMARRRDPSGAIRPQDDISPLSSPTFPACHSACPGGLDQGIRRRREESLPVPIAQQTFAEMLPLRGWFPITAFSMTSLLDCSLPGQPGLAE